jgi:hypothetical protein
MVRCVFVCDISVRIDRMSIVRVIRWYRGRSVCVYYRCVVSGGRVIT